MQLVILSVLYCAATVDEFFDLRMKNVDKSMFKLPLHSPL